MASFLVELYRSRSDAATLARDAEHARVAAEQLTREGRPVAFLRSIYVASDETCFLLYEATAAEHVAEAARRAAVPFERVVEAVTNPTGGTRQRMRGQTRRGR